jgi:hypothetical protein
MKPVSKKTREAIDSLAFPPVLADGIKDLARNLLVQHRAIEQHRHKSGARGQDGAPFDPRTINVLAATMLANYRCRQRPPQELVELISVLLTGVPVAGLRRAYAECEDWPTLTDEMVSALSYERNHPGASAREVAKAVGVDHKTIISWRRKNLLYFASLPPETRNKLPHPPGE